MKKSMLVIAAAVFASGCQSTNMVRPDQVIMDATSANYATDDAHCKSIAEGNDYFADVMKEAVTRGLVMGLTGAATGAIIGSQFGYGSQGAAIGAASAVQSAYMTDVAVNGLQTTTATTVWAECMHQHGHRVYKIKLHS